MPSRAERVAATAVGGAPSAVANGASRAAVVEGVFRALSFAFIAFAIWRQFAAGDGGQTVVAKASSLAHDLPSIESGRVARLHVEIDGPSTPAERDALAAVAHSGTRVTWSGANLPPLAAVAERAREPDGAVRIAVTSSAPVALSDALAALDTVSATGAAHGATVAVGAPSGAIAARSGALSAPVGVPAAPALRPVLVVGRAGWETKFTVAALEEQGWKVDELLFVAPGADVTQGSITAIDTSHFSTIVALDTTLGSVGPQIVRFVRSGGGLVLMADAANAPDVRAIAPARAGPKRIAGSRAFNVAEPVNAMPVYPLESPRNDAVPLSMRGALLTSAARREGAGRVLQAAYDETWRWRMEGGTDAVVAHRAWWSRMVGTVAATPVPSTAESASAEAAPLARLVDALGPPASVAPAPSTARRLPAWLFPALLLSLLGEWASRRWRGAT